MNNTDLNDLSNLINSANSVISSATDLSQVTSEITQQFSNMDKVYTNTFNQLSNNISQNFVTLDHFNSAMSSIAIWLLLLLVWNSILTIVLIVWAVKRRRAIKGK